MTMNFDQHAKEGNDYLSYLSQELSIKGETAKAAQIFKTVIHSLRDLIPIEENLQLLSQLPIFLKGIYVDGWTERKKLHVKHMDDLINHLRNSNHQQALKEMTDEEIERSISVVFITLRRYISLGELEDIKAVLPKDLKHMVDPVSMI